MSKKKKNLLQFQGTFSQAGMFLNINIIVI